MEDYIWHALGGTLFTWFLTAVGAAGIVAIPGDYPPLKQRRLLDCSFGFAAGVMLSASNWSLLNPALELAKQSPTFASFPWIPVSIGFLIGCLFVQVADQLLGQYHLDQLLIRSKFEDKTDKYESAMQWRRTLLIVIAVTVHNIPEGLAVGVAYATMPKQRANALALAIGLQNMPEGLAVSLPLQRAGFSSSQAFFVGQLSGMVEPISGVLGAYLVSICEPMLPWIMSFAAGAMVFVVFDDILPESTLKGNTRISTWSGICGFVLMMTLDLLL